jgi:NAD(P)-dependent dehydrogenase (short-subunit alcohol dehydrogenase family)
MFYLTQLLLPKMKAGAAIINTASVTAFRGSHHLLDYASTKGAVVAFTRSLATNLAEKGIRVNGVAPGPVITPLIQSSFGKAHLKKFGKDTALGRAGQPNEIAPAYVFLASKESSYILGRFIHPNGGEIVNA